VTGTTTVAINADLSGLSPNTIYHYRIVANSSAGTSNGTDLAFITSGFAPTATTDAATNVTATLATLNGTVNPNGLSTTVKFQYGTTTSYGAEVTALTSPISGISAKAVGAAILGLTPNTEYHYRVVATNSAGTTNGADQSFTTTGTAPIATTNAATSIAATSATLNGSVNPNGLSTTIKFQYGTLTGYGSEVNATPSSASGSTEVAASGTLSGLSPNTTYHYRVVGTNSAGTTNGADQSFSTASLAPTVTTNAATNITATSATLNGVVNPNGLNTSAEFEYGLNTDYGNLILLNPLTGTSSVPVSISTPRLIPGTTYHYRVAASNSAGETKGNDQTFITLSDVSPPQITHSPTAIANSGQNVEVSTAATDNDRIQSATLYYRQGGAMSFQSTPMNNSGGGNYAATIPASSVTERGLEYYISVTDPSNNTATYPATDASTHPQVVRVRSANLARAAQTPAMAYRMISVPIELENASPRNVLEDDWGNYNDTQWRLLRYVSGEDREYTVHNNFDNFDPGKGFWLITRNARTLAAGAGLSVTTAQNFVITLQPGWNQIGNPFAFPVNWSDVIKSGNVESKLVGYQGALNEASGYDYTRSRLEPWEGYFVNNLGSAPATLEIPPRAATEPLPKFNSMLAAMSLHENEWALRLSVTSAYCLDKDNYLGCLSSASEEWDRNDFSEAPFFDKHVTLYFPHHDWATFPGRYTGDFHPVSSQGQSWDFEVQTNVPNSKIKLELAEAHNLPSHWNLTLLDERSHVAIDLLKQPSYTFLLNAEKTVRTFRVLAGPPDYIGAHDQNLSGLPSDFELSPNYPNPFNPETKIGYTLPVICQVRIIVFNSTGQQVRKLVDYMHNAGRYTITWNGTNDAEESVASGIYLLRMEAGDFVALRKMVLAR